MREPGEIVWLPQSRLVGQEDVMYLYLYHRHGPFRDLETFDDLDHLDEQGFMPQIYVNLTNRCNNACTFCLRDGEAGRQSSLWIEREPSVEELCATLDRFDLSPINELVFCGFGEPTMRLDALLALARHVHETAPGVRVRLNTNGLANLQYGRDVTPELADDVDVVSVSLNTSDPTHYLELTRSTFGKRAYEAMWEFARLCKERGIDTHMTVVDVIGDDDIARCRRLCEEAGIKFRIRAYSA
jgi:TatD family-associated radical SAM protein